MANRTKIAAGNWKMNGNRAALPAVKPSNIVEIFAVADMDDGLVSGASQRAQDFIPIMRALAQTGEMS